jgi:hypothetical protein
LDLRSPILEAFFLTASVGLPSFAAILAVGFWGKSLVSRLRSLFVHTPLMAFFFAIARPLSQLTGLTVCGTFSFGILASDAALIKHFSSGKRKKASRRHLSDFAFYILTFDLLLIEWRPA